MRLKTLLEACPLNQAYGGIQSGGGYKAYTEYEVGFQRIMEALHCILGSLIKMTVGSKLEKGHIKEEFKLVSDFLDEYSKPLYIGKNFTANEYASESIASIKNASKKLIELVPKLKKGLEVKGKIRKVAENTYDMIYKVAYSALYSIDKDKVIVNGLANNKLISAKNILGNSIEELFNKGG